MTEEAQIPTQWTHSIKLETTAKGIRPTVHVYANDRETALNEAIGTYEVLIATIKQEFELGVKEMMLAPIEVSKEK